MQLLVVWTKCYDVSGSPTHRHCPPTTPICQPSKTLPPGFNKNPKLPASTEALATTEISTNHTLAKLMQMSCLKQHPLHLCPQAFQKLPKLRKCEAPCLKPKEAPREGTKSTAMPLAIKEALLPPQHPTTTCLKKSTMLQMPQEAVMLHPNQRSFGVHGAPKTVASTSTQLPTARC